MLVVGVCAWGGEAGGASRARKLGQAHALYTEAQHAPGAGLRSARHAAPLACDGSRLRSAEVVRAFPPDGDEAVVPIAVALGLVEAEIVPMEIVGEIAVESSASPSKPRTSTAGIVPQSTGQRQSRPKRSRTRWTYSGRTVPTALKDTLLAKVVARSERRWRAIFKECDADGDEAISRRELMVLLQRLEVPIPSDAELDILTREIDIDENGLIGFTECAALISQLGVRRTVDVARASNSLRATLRSYLYERQWLLLWRDTYDRMDSFPSDGQIDSLELGVAFEQLVQGRGAAGRAGQGYGFSQRIDTIMKRHGTDGDNQISFDEFKAKASDMVASGVQYERAVAACCTSERGLVRKVDAERRAALANAQNVPLDASMLAAVEARIQAAFAAENGLIAAAGVMRVQDDLYRRFKAKYAATLEAQGQRIDDTLTPKRVLLLDAITAGDLDGIRSLTQMSWDFIYPPAYVDPVSGERQLEAWCRTPLCLLVRPDEGNFESKLCGISEEDRQALLQDVLASGCADPNYPPIYWGNPAMHATFEGDLDALETLRLNGCDLRQKFEWVLQEEPLFSLVHAAAFNGQEAVLRYLRALYPPSFMRELDATGSNALHVTLESSRDLGTARFLLEQGVDGFAFNHARRTPLSISIECLPELALALLEQKSRFEYRWWGNDLYWFSFDGIILPLQDGRPLPVHDQNGEPTTIEQLIIRHERKELLETPLMLDVIERKWRSFAAELYAARVLKFVAMFAAVFAASVAEPGLPGFPAAVAAVFVTWAVNLQAEVARAQSVPVSAGGVGPLALLDITNLVVVPVVTLLDVWDSLDGSIGSLLDLPPNLAASITFVGGAVQVTLALRLLAYVSLFRVLGPLLVTVLAMFADAARFSGVLLVVIVGWANGFYSLIHSSIPSAELMMLGFDYSYSNILTTMFLWLSGQPSLGMITPLGSFSAETMLSAEVLFWSFLATAYFVLLNLLIAIFNSAYERVISNSIPEWLFIRLNTLLEFESDIAQPGVRAYYKQLQTRDGQRAMAYKRDDD